MANFVSGLITAGFLVSALFFVKFWRRSGDPLFVIFAAAFAILALDQTLVTFYNFLAFNRPEEEQAWAYLLRLAAFTLLAVAIIHKNARRSR
ncbi:MAG TPA: DUF5985 family protein [Stellaceae bacterium]|nr:DUF5985 family protein [Stellaceae bacterium]